jgi:hypothetical protein
VSKSGPDAMTKASKQWEAVAQVQAAAKLRQSELCRQYLQQYAQWEQDEDERHRRKTNKGRTGKKPQLTVVKHDVSADY